MDVYFNESTMLLVLLPAARIPDRSEVAKRTGEKIYTLRHDLTVYSDQKGEKPMLIKGLFLIDERGNINQISAETLIHWSVSVEDLRLFFEDALAEIPQ